MKSIRQLSSQRAPRWRRGALLPRAFRLALVLPLVLAALIVVGVAYRSESGSDGRGLVGAATVARVIDGDTIELTNGEHVRYVGMDTPETVHPTKPVMCYGHEASVENARLVEHREVRLERDTTDRDQYGRLLRYVYVDGQDVGAALIDGGYARAENIKPDIRHHPDYVAREKAAKSAKLGLWGACSKFGEPLAVQPTPAH